MSDQITYDSGEPTQVVHPGRAMWRTWLQTFLGVSIILFPAVPEILDSIDVDGVPSNIRAWSLAGAAVFATVASVFARLMAIPAINDALSVIKASARPRND